MNTTHQCCACALLLKDALKKCKREVQKLSRDLKTAQSRIERLKTQRKKLIEAKKQQRSKNLKPSFFK